MFNIKVSPIIESKLPLNLVRAIGEVNELFKVLKSNINILPLVTFDPLYTKPIHLTSHDILSEALSKDITLSVQLYTQNWFAYKLAPVNAYVNPSEPDIIHFNTRMFGWDKPVHVWKETVHHECVHLMDKHSQNRFDHGENNLKGKENSAPVKLGKLLSLTSHIHLVETLHW